MIEDVLRNGLWSNVNGDCPLCEKRYKNRVLWRGWTSGRTHLSSSTWVLGGCREGRDLDVRGRADSTVFKISFHFRVPGLLPSGCGPPAHLPCLWCPGRRQSVCKGVQLSLSLSVCPSVSLSPSRTGFKKWFVRSVHTLSFAVWGLFLSGLSTSIAWNECFLGLALHGGASWWSSPVCSLRVT